MIFSFVMFVLVFFKFCCILSKNKKKHNSSVIIPIAVCPSFWSPDRALLITFWEISWAISLNFLSAGATLQEQPHQSISQSGSGSLSSWRQPIIMRARDARSVTLSKDADNAGRFRAKSIEVVIGRWHCRTFSSSCLLVGALEHKAAATSYIIDTCKAPYLMMVHYRMEGGCLAHS